MAPSSFLFLSTLFSGTIIALSSSNWLYLWIGMELNLLSFIPIMASSSLLQETEASVKYFIVQAIGSGLMLTAGIMSLNPITTHKYAAIPSIIFMLSMLIKLGAAPCHQWLPHVMSSLPWILCMLLATWQKVAPMLMLILLTPNKLTYMIMLTAAMGAMVGGIGGLNQSQLRALLAYSSIGHMGWMMATMKFHPNLFFIYFLTYILITLSLMMLLMKTATIMNRLPFSVVHLNPILFTMMMLIMFSLGGLPPFIGFLPKWLIINNLATTGLFFLMATLITGSLMNLFYYFNMTFNFILFKERTQMPYMAPRWGVIATMMCTISSLLIVM
nr:NADH dehydrogenase subunit 2 [Pseudonereis variegata]